MNAYRRDRQTRFIELCEKNIVALIAGQLFAQIYVTCAPDKEKKCLEESVKCAREIVRMSNDK